MKTLHSDNVFNFFELSNVQQEKFPHTGRMPTEYLITLYTSICSTQFGSTGLVVGAVSCVVLIVWPGLFGLRNIEVEITTPKYFYADKASQ